MVTSMPSPTMLLYTQILAHADPRVPTAARHPATSLTTLPHGASPTRPTPHLNPVTLRLLRYTLMLLV